ncbi:hypothetical protein [Maribellus comscasis]|nr:hypothetical protein [Maribellus comscasis]
MSSRVPKTGMNGLCTGIYQEEYQPTGQAKINQKFRIILTTKAHK